VFYDKKRTKNFKVD